MTWKFRQIKPQKARGKFTEALWDDPVWIAEEKFDGERRIAQFCGGVVRFTGCSESVDGTGFVEKSAQVPHLSNIGHLDAVWRQTKVLPLDGTVLDGEMVPPPGTKIKGGGSKYVTSIMGSNPEEAVRKQRERGYLCYKVFDCLWYKGQDNRNTPLHIRRTYAIDAVKEWKNSYVSVSEIHSDKDVKKQLYRRAAEGVVFKRVDHIYGNENLWVKKKKAWTADVVITGFTEGKGKYNGQIGAIEFGQYVTTPGNKGARLRPYGRCSGFPDEYRKFFTEAPQNYTGGVIEITHNGREPSGKFRHPQFSRWRLDKSPRDCVYDQDES